MSDEQEAELESPADDEGSEESSEPGETEEAIDQGDGEETQPADEVDADADDAAGDEGDETADAEGDDDAAGDDDDEDGLQSGTFVRLAFTARTVEDDTLVDTTEEDVAEEEGVADRGEFEPRTIVLGEGHVFGPVEDDIYGKSVGDTGTVTVPAAQAFGEYDPDDVQTVSVEKIPEDDRYPGAHVNVNGRHGHVATIVGGRARVDFNHPLAGEDVEYDYEIVGEVEDRVERAKGLLSMYLDQDLEVWIETDEVEEEVLVEPEEDEAEADADDEGADAEDADEEETDAADDDEEDEPAEPEYETQVVEKETLYIEATPQLTMNQQWMFSKQQIAQDVTSKLDLDRVVVQEIIDGAGGMGFPGMMGGAGANLDEGAVEAADIVDELEE